MEKVRAKRTQTMGIIYINVVLKSAIICPTTENTVNLQMEIPC